MDIRYGKDSIFCVCNTFHFRVSETFRKILLQTPAGQEMVLVVYDKQATRDTEKRCDSLTHMKYGEDISPSSECCPISSTFHWPVLITCIVRNNYYLVLLFQYGKQART